MNSEDIYAAGNALFEAEKSGTQIGILSQKYHGMSLDDAYKIQKVFVEQKKAVGGQIIGWKIGLTSRAMQQALGITTPDSGVLFADMVFSNHSSVPAGRFIQPRIEAELAFVLKDALQGDVTREQVILATDYVVPALEILDTRILRTDGSGAQRLVTDTISDNASNAGIVLGNNTLPADLDLRWVGAIIERDGVVEETGLGAGVLNDPVLGIVWLVRRLAKYGAQLEPGQVVLSGSFIRPIECPPGATIKADFGASGCVEIEFE